MQRRQEEEGGEAPEAAEGQGGGWRSAEKAAADFKSGGKKIRTNSKKGAMGKGEMRRRNYGVRRQSEGRAAPSSGWSPRRTNEAKRR